MKSFFRFNQHIKKFEKERVTIMQQGLLKKDNFPASIPRKENPTRNNEWERMVEADGLEPPTYWV